MAHIRVTDAYASAGSLCASLAGNTDQRTNPVTNTDKRIMVTNTDKQIIF